MVVKTCLWFVAFSTNFTTECFRMHFLQVALCFMSFYPQVTIVAPIKLLQHNRVRFNVMRQVQIFVPENFLAAATFPVVGGDNFCVFGCAGCSKTVSLYIYPRVWRKSAFTALVWLVSEMFFGVVSGIGLTSLTRLAPEYFIAIRQRFGRLFWTVRHVIRIRRFEKHSFARITLVQLCLVTVAVLIHIIRKPLFSSHLYRCRTFRARGYCSSKNIIRTSDVIFV